ncbi:hypothetical protein AAEX37_02018 [Oligella sp. MSHR50489EDL]|uniref:type III-B CRISPR module RAMP protein Cmr4 n=1 Tax=Oligella sp. MSHR50489EDL TaxID=3139409 RepID=UPI003D819FB5
MNSSVFVGLMAETAIHAGASGANHVIDLPIMREHNTGWPVVFGSAVKGALRAKAEQGAIGPEDKELLFTLFGPDTDNAEAHAGSLLIGDARLLLLPVRSLTTQFRYVTCPDLIARFQRDQQRAGLPKIECELPAIAAEEALVAGDCGQLFLEEYVFQPRSTGFDLSGLISALVALTERDEKEIKEKLTIVSNDQFALLCRAAIPVNAHIAIDNANKTVKQGALWYEESLPAETLLYTVIGAHDSRNAKLKKSASELLKDFKAELFISSPYLQIGGNETTGMGWCKVTFLGGAV